MSTLTKVFTIALVVSSIVFASMTVSNVVQQKNWRDTALKFEEHARVADTNLRHEIAASAAQLATARDEIRALSGRIASLEPELGAAAAETSRVRADLAKAEADKSSADAMNRGLLAELRGASTARDEYQTQRDELERTHLETATRNIDLNDRVNELTSVVDVLLEEKRQYEQQINMLVKQRRAGSAVPEFEQSGGATAGVTAVTPIATREIRGRIAEVDGDLVTVSIGSDDGVKKNMVFVIHRNGEYVGDFRVTMVDPSRSAGRVLRSNGRPQAGDLVTDERTLRASQN